MDRQAEKAGPWNLVHALSLDVVAGALAMAVMAVHVTATQVTSWYWPILALAVWSVYSADHWFDALRAGTKSTGLRHRLHYRLREPMGMLILGTATAAVVLGFLFLPRPLVIGGLLLGLFATLYFLMVFLGIPNRKRWMFRELSIATTYSLGTWLAPLSLGLPGAWQLKVLLAMVWLTVFANLVMNGIFEHEEDQAGGFASMSTQLGKGRATIAFWLSILAALLLFGASALFYIPTRIMAAMFFVILIDIVLLLLFRYADWSSIRRRYRKTSDLLYSLPFLILLVS